MAVSSIRNIKQQNRTRTFQSTVNSYNNSNKKSVLNQLKVSFAETFTGDGLTAAFQLTNNIQNAVFIGGLWKAENILINEQSSIVRSADLKAVYNSTNILTRSRIKINSISTTGLVVLSHPPRAGQDIQIHYKYHLSANDTIKDYTRADVVGKNEVDTGEIERLEQVILTNENDIGVNTNQIELLKQKDWDYYADKMRYNGTETSTAGGKVYEGTVLGVTKYRFISDATDANGYPVTDAFYSDSGLTNLIAERV